MNGPAIRQTSLLGVILLTATLVAPGALVLAQEAEREETFDYPHRMLPEPESSYDPAIPSPEQTLGFRVGDRAAFPDEIVTVFEAMADASPRARLFEYARTHEGRPSIYMAISSAANIARLDTIKAGLGQLADPRGLDDSAAEDLMSELPVTAWLAYSIHGDETSGADASMLVAYHLIASQSEETAKWLDEMVILIDPNQNPDGRHRYLTQVQQHRAKSANVDNQSLLHTGHWPWGRTNHYLFDMNRDWILGVNPEPRGRIVESRLWYPLLFVDAHEMGSLETYLFSPDTEPLNRNFPEYLAEWQQEFGRDQAAAFDSRGWTYYNGEWADNWYPGYGSSWGKLIGAVAILYEQAGLTEDGIRRPEGTVITYHEAAHHQAVSSWANLQSLFENRDTLRRGFLEDRRSVVAGSGPYANRSWVVFPSANTTRLSGFLDKLDLQGIEYTVAGEGMSVGPGRDAFGNEFSSRQVPAGSIVISNRQPNARMAAAVLEFDPRLSEDILKKERSEVLKTGGGVMYDVTAWNLIMYYGLDGLEVDRHLATAAESEASASSMDAEEAPVTASEVGYVVDGADDASLRFAASLMEAGVYVRMAEKDFQLDGESFTRGSIVVHVTDNRDCGVPSPDLSPGHSDRIVPDCDLQGMVSSTARDLGQDVHSISTGQGPGDLPDLGGEYFDLLERPQLAIVARDGVSSYSFGSIWHAVDTGLGIRHTHLDGDYVSGSDLRRYNVIVLPSKSSWDQSFLDELKGWVENGGTLIAVGRSSFALADGKTGLTKVRLLRDVLGDLDDYEVSVHRDFQARMKQIPDAGSVFSHGAGIEGPSPWDPDFKRPDSTFLARQDSWRRLFMPAGAPLIATRTNPYHWLTAGLGDSVPLLYDGSQVLMAKSDVQSALRAGVLVASASNGSNSSQASPSKEARVGWSSLPDGYELKMRMSGLLWPEATQRLANAPVLTREQVGRGQVILMAFEPAFRGTTHGATRILMNAIVLGPGVGTSAVIRP